MKNYYLIANKNVSPRTIKISMTLLRIIMKNILVRLINLKWTNNLRTPQIEKKAASDEEKSYIEWKKSYI